MTLTTFKQLYKEYQESNLSVRDFCSNQALSKSLQWILTHSFHAKLWAVKRVAENKGKRTPGVDKIRWKTSSHKLSAAKSLVRKGYKALPLRRLYILKKNGKKTTVRDSHHERPGFSGFIPSGP